MLMPVYANMSHPLWRYCRDWCSSTSVEVLSAVPVVPSTRYMNTHLFQWKSALPTSIKVLPNTHTTQNQQVFPSTWILILFKLEMHQ